MRIRKQFLQQLTALLLNTVIGIVVVKSFFVFGISLFERPILSARQYCGAARPGAANVPIPGMSRIYILSLIRFRNLYSWSDLTVVISRYSKIAYFIICIEPGAVFGKVMCSGEF